jgi:hypothetical protein
MSDSQPPKPLPRFQPRAAPSPASSTSQRMSNSLSVDAGLNRFQTKKERPPPVPRPPRQRQLQFIEFGDRPHPLHTQVTSVFAPPPSHVHESHDEIESETISAVKLPLVSQRSMLPPRELLTPEANDKLLLVQLPSSLPIVYPNDASQLDYNPLFSVADGHLGTIRIHKSGKVTAKIGNIVFNVESGVTPSCAQMICVKKETGLEYAPIQGGKLKFTIDVERLHTATQADTS